MFQCKNGCGYESEHRGTMNLHEKMHCKKVRVQGEVAAEKKVRKKAAAVITGECEQGGEHNWRLLSRGNQTELNAINAGYGEVCVKCQDLQ